MVSSNMLRGEAVRKCMYGDRKKKENRVMTAKVLQLALMMVGCYPHLIFFLG